MPAKISFSTDRNAPAQFARRLGAGSKFAEDAIAAGARAALRRVEAIGDAAVAEVNARVDQLYNGRIGNRHKKDAVRLHNSFFVDIESKGRTSRNKPSFPFTILLQSAADTRHVMALNRGSRPHVISARPGRFLIIPRYGLGESIPYQWSKRPKRLQSKWLVAAPGRVAKHTQHTNSDASRRLAVPGSRFKISSVNHPGIRASYFMEYSLEVAADRVLRSKVRVKKSR